MAKIKEIESEKKKLAEIFSDIPENKKKLCAKLIENAAFMAVTLDKLQNTINEEGPVIVLVNGNGFEITQEHPAQKSYISMVAKYSAIISQLTNLLPDKRSENVVKAGENLAKYVASGKPIEIR